MDLQIAENPYLRPPCDACGHPLDPQPHGGGYKCAACGGHSSPAPVEVVMAALNGCRPRIIHEMGEWSWWACQCPDKRHGVEESYFQDRLIKTSGPE